MRLLLKDPLVHFLAVGALLFVVFNARDPSPPPGRVTIDAAQVRSLTQAQALISESPLTREQVMRLVEPAIRDEIYYREALALGLDVDDDQVRTRLIEKMRYLSENLADPEPSDEAALKAFFDANPERFIIPELISFEHVFFSPSQRPETVVADANSALVRLRSGESGQNMGDRTPLEYRFENASRERLDVLFGEQMTAAMFAAPIGNWEGPLESDFGLHLVRVTVHSAARQPDFAAAREAALAAFAAQQRQQRNEAAFAEMRARYTIDVEIPESLVSGNP